MTSDHRQSRTTSRCLWIADAADQLQLVPLSLLKAEMWGRGLRGGGESPDREASFVKKVKEETMTLI